MIGCTNGCTSRNGKAQAVPTWALTWASAGAPRRTRTYNPRIKRHSLCRVVIRYHGEGRGWVVGPLCGRTTRLLSSLLSLTALLRRCRSATRCAGIARLGRVCLVQLERPVGGHPGVVGPEALRAGGRTVRHLSLTSMPAGSARSPPERECSRHAGRPGEF